MSEIARGRAGSAQDRGVEVDAGGAVIGAADPGQQEGATNEGQRLRRGEDVVDAPADVARPRTLALAPPAVVAGAGLEAPEGVDPARCLPAVELGALLGEEAARLAVLARAREVDLAVCGVEVADHEHAPPRAPQPRQAPEERGVEGELVGHAAVVAQPPAALREVGVRDREPAEVRDLEPPLRVEARLAERGLDAVRRLAREDPDAAVARPLGGDEVGREAPWRAQRCGDPVERRAHLLHADEPGAGAREPAPEPLARARPEAVHVPGEHAERCGRPALPLSHPATGTCTPRGPAGSAGAAAPTPRA